MQTVSRNILLDIFKIIAAIFIIAIHCGFFFEYNKIVYHLLCDGFFKIAIPFFFCVNGFFLFDVFENHSIKIWAKRIGILYLIWMLIFVYFWGIPALENPIKIIPIILFGFNHLWYLAALLLGGLLLYSLRRLSNTTLIISAIILFITALLIQYLGVFHVFAAQPILDKLMNYPPLHRNFLLYALPFLSIGYVIRRMNLHTKLNKQKITMLLLISVSFLIVDNLINLNYLKPEILLNINFSFLFLGPILLLASFSFKVTSTINSKLLSSCSIALYLVHPLIIILITSFFKLDSTSLTFVTIILSGIVSYFLILLNNKLKYIL